MCSLFVFRHQSYVVVGVRTVSHMTGHAWHSPYADDGRDHVACKVEMIKDKMLYRCN